MESIIGWRALEDGRALDECIGRGGKTAVCEEGREEI